MLLLTALLLGGVTVTLPPEARVRGTEIELASIARVDGSDQAETARVRSLKLGWAPAPGYSRLILAGRLAQDLARTLPDVTIEVRGADCCRVWPHTERVSGAVLEAAARNELRRALEGRDAEARLVESVADLEVPSGAHPCELRALPGNGALKPGCVDVPVRVLVDGALYRTVWTRWDLGLWEECSVPRESIRAGEVIDLERLEKRRVASRGARTDAPLPAILIAGATAARDLPAGLPVTERDLIRPLLVRRGDALFLEVRHGRVTARVAAVAEADGRQNERIRVTLVDSRRTLQATVLSRDVALIDLSAE